MKIVSYAKSAYLRKKKDKLLKRHLKEH